MLALTDPRNERRGLVVPPTTANTDTDGIRLRHWVDAPYDDDEKTFRLVRVAGSSATFGPALGDMSAFADRMTIVNGLSMGTVSHPDGIAFSTTGRHLAGSQPAAPTVDTMLANEFGRDQLIPVAALSFPSVYQGTGLDKRVVPLKIPSLAAVQKTLRRSAKYEGVDDRNAVTDLLATEADDLAATAVHPEVLGAWGSQLRSLRAMEDTSGTNIAPLFDSASLLAAYPSLEQPYRDAIYGRPSAAQKKPAFLTRTPADLAFAVDAMKRNVARCVSLTMTGFDTHFASDHRAHAARLQEGMNLLARFLEVLEETPHPTLTGDTLAAHTHVLVVSDFCRTPHLSVSGGRDHHANNSSIVISPRLRGGTVVGITDVDQVLPRSIGGFADGERPVAPPDVLATLLHACGVDPRRYMRDGEPVSSVVR